MKNEITETTTKADKLAWLNSGLMCDWKHDGGANLGSLWNDVMYSMGDVYRGELERMIGGVVPEYERKAFSSYRKALWRFNPEDGDEARGPKETDVQTTAKLHTRTMVECLGEHTSLDAASIDDAVQAIQATVRLYILSFRTQDGYSIEECCLTGTPYLNDLLSGLNEGELVSRASSYNWPDKPIVYGLFS